MDHFTIQWLCRNSQPISFTISYWVIQCPIQSIKSEFKPRRDKLWILLTPARTPEPRLYVSPPPTRSNMTAAMILFVLSRAPRANHPHPFYKQSQCPMCSSTPPARMQLAALSRPFQPSTVVSWCAYAQRHRRTTEHRLPIDFPATVDWHHRSDEKCSVFDRSFKRTVVQIRHIPLTNNPPHQRADC